MIEELRLVGVVKQSAVDPSLRRCSTGIGTARLNEITTTRS
jgi:hypothetical protein